MSTEPHESNPGHPPAASPAWVDFPGAPSSFAAGRPDAGSRNPNSPNPKGPRDWEGLIGGKWALWVGAFSLFLSVACFLGYTWNAVWSHLPPPTPSEKTAMGFAGGLALMVLGGLLRNRTQRWYGEGLTGAGLGIAYLSLWAGAEYFRILGFMPAFGAMTGLTALGVVLASGYRALSLSLLSTTLGFLTPMLLEGSGARGSALGFLGYIALLDAGVLAVSLLRGWRSLTGLSFVLTVISVGSWANATDLTSIRLLTWGFLTLYAVSFVAAALFGSLGRKEATDSVDLLLFISAGTLYIVAGQAVLAPLFLPFPGIFLLGLALAFAQLSLWINLGAPGNRILLFAAEGLALLALTIAVPVQLREPGVLAIAWVLEAMVLVLAGRRFGSALIRIAGRLVWLLSLLAVGFSWILAHCGDGYILPRTVLAPHLLFLNNGALPLLVAVITAYILAVSGWEKGTGPAATDSFGSLYAAYGTLGGAWLVAQETALGCQWGHYPAASTEGTGAVFLGSALVCVYALAVFVPAARIRHWGLCRLASWVALAGACIPLWAALGGAIPGGHPFWNLRFASVLVVTLASGPRPCAADRGHGHAIRGILARGVAGAFHCVPFGRVQSRIGICPVSWESGGRLGPELRLRHRGLRGHGRSPGGHSGAKVR